jgi:hypothetical protein
LVNEEYVFFICDIFSMILGKFSGRDLKTFFKNLFEVLGFELRAYTWSHSASPFIEIGVFKIGSHKLFAQAYFESLSF